MSTQVKESIKRSFNRAVTRYDQHCLVQNETAEKAIKMLKGYKRHYSHVADFACGTGESTVRLIRSIQYHQCTAIDFAESALSLATNKLSYRDDIGFVLGDFDEVVFSNPCLDLIFCNMGLQWSADLPLALARFNRYLLPSGVMLISIPIRGNFPEINKDYKLSLLSHDEIIEAINKQNITLLQSELTSTVIRLNSQFELLKSLKNVGANYNKLKPTSNRGLSRINFDAIFKEVGNKKLTYNIGIYLIEGSKE